MKHKTGDAKTLVLMHDREQTLKEDARLQSIYRTAKEHLELTGGKDLSGAISEDDFEYVLTKLETKERDIRVPSLSAEYPKLPLYSFLMDLAAPYFKLQFLNFPDSNRMGVRNGDVSQSEHYARYLERIRQRLMPFCVQTLCLVRRWQTGRTKEDRIWRSWSLGKIEHPSTARESFIRDCGYVMIESLSMEIIRWLVASEKTFSPKELHELDQPLEQFTRNGQDCYPFVLLMIEGIPWFAAFLSDRVKEPDRFMMNKFYFILDRQLRIARQFDEIFSKMRLSDHGFYVRLRNMMFDMEHPIFGRHMQRIFRKLLGTRRSELESCLGLKDDSLKRTVEQEILSAAVAAVENFDCRRTERPMDHFHRRIELDAKNKLYKLKRKRIICLETDIPSQGKKERTEDATPDNFSLDTLRPSELPEDNIEKRLEILSPPELKEALMQWISVREADILVEKANGKTDSELAEILNLSESRIRGLSAQAQKTLMAKFPYPEILRLALSGLLGQAAS